MKLGIKWLLVPLDIPLGDSTVFDELKKKHPTSSPINYDQTVR